MDSAFFPTHNSLLVMEPWLRLGSFLLLLSILWWAERRWPRRALRLKKSQRWVGHFWLMCTNSILIKAIGPLTAIHVALWCHQQQLGLLYSLATTSPNGVPWYHIIVITISVLLLDVAIYWQHRAMHAFPLLWRLHKVHHADLDLDVSSGVRFHPLEMLCSMLYKSVVIAALGAPVIAVVIFEIWLSLGALFSHSNVHLPRKWDTWVRRVIVTPDMHRVHHSQLNIESEHNFGFGLSWWDRVFNSYQHEPLQGQKAMKLGLSKQGTHNVVVTWSKLLALPFQRQADAVQPETK